MRSQTEFGNEGNTGTRCPATPPDTTHFSTGDTKQPAQALKNDCSRMIVTPVTNLRVDETVFFFGPIINDLGELPTNFSSTDSSPAAHAALDAITGNGTVD